MKLLEKTWAALLRLLRKLKPARRRNNSRETPRASEYWDEPVWRDRAERDEWRSDLSAYLAASGFDPSAPKGSDNISVYSCTHINNMCAAHPIRIPCESVREQVSFAPPRSPLEHYPKFHIGFEHWNREYKLRARLPWFEFPILDNSSGRVWTPGDAPGPVRVVYNDEDRTKFDIIYHDPLVKRFRKATRRASGAVRGEGSRARDGVATGQAILPAD